MSPECPRCSIPVALGDEGWRCQRHGLIAPLWRAQAVTADVFDLHLTASSAVSTYLPWPLTATWAITDFGHVADHRGTHATVVSCAGVSALDGPVEIDVISEEPGTGLGSRIAGRGEPEAHELAAGKAELRVHVGGRLVPLWILTTATGAVEELDRSVAVGEAQGRWLWLVMRPASALLLMRDDWILQSITHAEVPTMSLSFGGERPRW